jgi:hypothetical protein
MNPWSFDRTRPHYRRTRANLPPPRRVGGRTWVVVFGVGAGILASIAALSVGSFVIGSFATAPPQSAAGGIPNAPPGVSFVYAEVQLVNASTIPAAGSCNASNLGTSASPTALTNGTTTGLCMNTASGGFSTSDYMWSLELGWNSSAAASTVFRIQVVIAVTPAANDLSITSYVKTSASLTPPEFAVYGLDMTKAGDTSIQQYSVLVTEL